MNEEQGDCIGNLALLMNVVNVQSSEAIDLNVSGKLRELVVQLNLLLPPVKYFPLRNKSFDVLKRCTVFQTSILQLVWKRGDLKLLPKSTNAFLWYVDLKGCFHVVHVVFAAKRLRTLQHI